MKKRIAALLLCLVMIVTMLPATIGSVRGASIPACDCDYTGDAGLEAHSDGCARKFYLRHTYIVENSAEEIYSEWAELDEQTRSAVLMFLSWDNYAKYTELSERIAGGEVEPSDKVTVYLNGQEVSEVAMPQYEKPTLSAATTLSGDVSCRWQILADARSGLWVDIYGENERELTLSYGMVASLLDSNNRAWVRCVTTSDSGELIGEAICVTMEPYVAPVTESAPEAPVEEPTQEPTEAPTEESTEEPTEEPTEESTEAPTEEPTEETTEAPTTEPAEAPTETPTEAPTEGFTEAPTTEPVAEAVGAARTDRAVNRSSVLTNGFRFAGTGSGITTASATDETTGTSGGGTTIYSILIEYVFENGTTAATPYTSTVGATTILNTTVTFPTVQGYLPYLGNSTDNDWVQTSSYTFTNAALTENFYLKVTYKPDLVDYKVHIYHQNVSDDKYTFVETITNQAFTGTVPDSYYDETYPGFYQLLYEKPAIAADGSTEVNIYYDRHYYLMNFNLDGGYGADAVYARYGTPISVDTPSKSGYMFTGWDETIPETMPAENKTYTAQWTSLEGVKFTVAYWLEDPNSAGNYHYWGSYQLTGRTGDPVNPADYAVYPDEVGNTLDVYEKRYSYYSHVGESTTISGDGSTVVNVYYNRNEYTLKFYYAMSSGTEGNEKYYVIGGSTYYFGKNALINDDQYKQYEKNLLNQYMINGDGYENAYNQRGEVTSLPRLNETGQKRYTDTKDESYTPVFETSDVNGTEYKYYYISFQAKYGADISEMWPCNVFDKATTTETYYKYDGGNLVWSGNAAFVSAWNGEHHVYYSQHPTDYNGIATVNQTIKGNYNELDYKLLWDFEDFGDSPDKTVTFLCFWENGTNINWSRPELYIYNIYVPSLDGTGYILKNQYYTCDDSTPGEQTPTAINGFTYDHATPENVDHTQYKDENGNLLYSDAFDVNFYYTRNSYDLTFVNGSSTVKQELVPFESDISAMAPTDLTYYEAELGDIYEFVGWYTTPEAIPGTEYDLAGKTMPANKLTLYAEWRLISHEVRIYPSETDADNSTNQIGDMLVVTHGDKIPEDKIPADPTNGEYKFAGWFYKDEKGIEHAFDFEHMAVMGTRNIYAKWSSNVLKPYIIRYRTDAGGEVTEDTVWVADLTEGSGLAGTTKTFYALGAEDLYEEFREGWFPLVTSHSFTLSIDGENTYDFIYVKKDVVPYTVHYYKVDDDGNYILDDNGNPVKLLESKTVSDNRKAIVTENFVAVSGYMPDAFQKTLIVSAADGAVNEIIFKYKEDIEHAFYKVSHYTQNIDGTWAEYSGYEAMGEIGTTYTENPLTIPGFTYDTSVDGSLSNGELTEEGLHLKLYYTRNQYPYKVRYLEEGTNKVLAEEKNAGTAYYGATVYEQAETIQGYTCVSDNQQSMTIREESGEDPVTNIITFYYTENTATIRYEVVGRTGCGALTLYEETAPVLTGSLTGSNATASEGYQFMGWYTDAGCTVPVKEAWLTGNKLNPQSDRTEGSLYESATYYAKFEKYLTVNYVSLGNGTVNPTTETVLESARFTGSLAAPATGYKFVGWYEDEACTVLASSAALYIPNNDQDGKTFYAKFDLLKGDLTVSKTITIVPNSGAWIDYDAEFSFTVQMPEDAVFTAGQTFAVTGNSRITEVTLDSSDAFTFTLKHGESITIKDLPAGSYVVTEAPASGYASSFPIPGADGSVQETVIIQDGETKELDCVNTYPVYFGNLTISKTVTKENPLDTLPEDTFTFTVQLKEGCAGATYQATGVVNSVTADENACITLQLKNGESVTILDLPEGNCTVTETVPEAYTTAYTVNGEEMSSGKIVIASGQENTVAVTNQYKSQRRDLTITRASASDEEQVFVYEVKNTATQDVITVTVVGNGSTTIHDLPFGTYTVTQINGWSWRYTDNVQTVTLDSSTDEENGAAVTFGDTTENDKWLDGNSPLIENRAKGGG